MYMLPTAMTSFQLARSQFFLTKRRFTVATPSLEARKSSSAFTLNPITRILNRRLEYQNALTSYQNITAHVEDKENREFFINTLKLPDTFETWFYLTTLHMWMLSTRGRAAGEAWQSMWRDMSEILWTDCEKRMYEGGVTNFTLINRGLKDLLAAHYGHLLAYDEGLSKGDAILAGALWRNLFSESSDVSILDICTAIKYVRHELVKLDRASSEEIIAAGNTFGKARVYS
ncbi:hypothetical protein M427DRAFT_152336 [Gonapodya prolifera JEL478]|uniref:Ubiquinol-cytochrome c chaperone domain-containing protein n=1 Tax=Gonapodya prolifera (strain JEL478) TaxID=1344416 RepID=A0A139AT42_GONPJ|nr:hypothetical protein M427DRAFT_152336 [Gonapodya prolifera JEL478]|eukprot:KXS19898.1 hypothetical protein M427DRAFT_152336 [Gonapodya prolifera JEL478]